MSELYNLKNTVTLYNPLYLPFEILLWMLFTVWYAKLIYIIGGDVNALYLLDGSVYYQCYILRKLSIFPPSETTKMYLFRIYTVVHGNWILENKTKQLHPYRLSAITIKCLFDRNMWVDGMTKKILTWKVNNDNMICFHTKVE